MKTVVLKFSDSFAPKEGTIEEHNKIIDKYGFVWYGKKGNVINSLLTDEINNYDIQDRKIILVKSVTHECYIAEIEKIENYVKPENKYIPEYYWDWKNNINCWIKIKCFKKVDKSILQKATVCSSQRTLSEAFYHSMTPIFIVDIDKKEMK